MGEPELDETITQAGVAAISKSVTVVQPQIEDVVVEPYNLFLESFKKGSVTIFELPRKYTNELVYVTVLIASQVVNEQGLTKLTEVIVVYEQVPPQVVVCFK